MSSARRAMSSAPRSVLSSSAAAAACAYGPPLPIATTPSPSSGSMTSPSPLRSRIRLASATMSIASRRRRYLSVRHSLLRPMAARTRLPWCLSRCCSNLSNSVSASATAPANPQTTWPWKSRRTFEARAFITMSPTVTWPSPATATVPPRCTATTVVACAPVIRGRPWAAGTCRPGTRSSSRRGRTDPCG